jgi:hypothetical protein
MMVLTSTLRVGGNLAGCMFGVAWIPVKTDLALIMVDDGAVFTSLTCQRHHYCSSRLVARFALVETQDPSLLDWEMATSGDVLPLEASFLEQVLAGRLKGLVWLTRGG